MREGTARAADCMTFQSPDLHRLQNKPCDMSCMNGRRGKRVGSRGTGLVTQGHDRCWGAVGGDVLLLALNRGPALFATHRLLSHSFVLADADRFSRVPSHSGDQHLMIECCRVGGLTFMPLYRALSRPSSTGWNGPLMLILRFVSCR